MGFLIMGVLLSSPTPCNFEITNFFIILNPLLMFPSLTLIHFCIFYDLITIYISKHIKSRSHMRKIRKNK